MTIEAPKHPAEHPDRAIDCTEAIETKFSALTIEALEAGWTKDDVAQALLNLSMAQQSEIPSSIETQGFSEFAT